MMTMDKEGPTMKNRNGLGTLPAEFPAQAWSLPGSVRCGQHLATSSIRGLSKYTPKDTFKIKWKLNGSALYMC